MSSQSSIANSNGSAALFDQNMDETLAEMKFQLNTIVTRHSTDMPAEQYTTKQGLVCALVTLEALLQARSLSQTSNELGALHKVIRDSQEVYRSFRTINLFCVMSFVMMSQNKTDRVSFRLSAAQPFVDYYGEINHGLMKKVQDRQRVCSNNMKAPFLNRLIFLCRDFGVEDLSHQRIINEDDNSLMAPASNASVQVLDEDEDEPEQKVNGILFDEENFEDVLKVDCDSRRIKVHPRVWYRQQYEDASRKWVRTLETSVKTKMNHTFSSNVFALKWHKQSLFNLFLHKLARE